MLTLLLACAAHPVTLNTDSAEVGTDPERHPPTSTQVLDFPEGDDDDPTEPEVEVEDIAGINPEGLCQMALTCDSAIPDEPKITCDLQVVSEEGAVYYEGPAGVETRGRSSASFAKPQYAVELQDDAGVAAQADLAGMGRASDWVLNGAWVDRALFRNKLSYDLFSDMGGSENYAPESRFCELELNGDYAGVYLLVERVQQEPARIDIPDEGLADGTAFVMKNDETGLVPNGIGYGAWNLVSPNEASVSTEAAVAIRGALFDWQNAATGVSPGDPDTGVFHYVDIDSAVDIVIIEEFAKNNDAYFLSMHLWKDTDSLLRFTPWDLDLAYGQPSYNNNEPPEEWVLYRAAMIESMTESEDFRARLVARWAELRADLFTEENINARIDSYLATMGPAVDRNFERWPIEDVVFGPYLYDVASHDEEVARVRTWIGARLLWMDANIADY